MPLVTSKEILQLALAERFAVGAFNANNMEMVQAIVETAQEERAPVILQVSQGAIRYAGLDFAAGMVKIIGAPTAETLPVINEKVKEYDIQVCIHNHGPGDKHFPTPLSSYEQIKDLDERIGFCHDVGHTVRYGEDAIAETEKCADRMLDFHIKDVTEATKSGHATPCGRGIIDIPLLLRTLIKIGYSGFLAFEYEEHANDPLPGLAESVGYVRGVLDTL